MTSPEQILSEFIDAWNAGRRPDLEAFVERASPPDRAALAASIGGWLTFAPQPAYDAATLDQIRTDPLLVGALERVRATEPLPAVLPRLRERAGLSLAALASSLTAALGLEGGGREQKAERYLGELEEGALDPGGLSARLLDALARALGVARDQLGDIARAALPAPAQAIEWRADGGDSEAATDNFGILERAGSAPVPEAWDEIDELFRGGG